MKVNPLDLPGTVFDLDLSNPNPTSSKTKDGPIYRLSFEVPRETWDLFMDADTKGMVLAAKACVVDLSGALALEAPTKGPYGKQAAILFVQGVQRCATLWPMIGSDALYLSWLREQPCCCADWYDGVDVFPAQHGGEVQAAHVRRVAAGAGTGIKPEYSAIPLCAACHARQHQVGETGIGGRDWADREAKGHVHAWAWQVLPQQFGVDSMTKVAPAQLCAWADERGLGWLVPAKYRESQ